MLKINSFVTKPYARGTIYLDVNTTLCFKYPVDIDFFNFEKNLQKK